MVALKFPKAPKKQRGRGCRVSDRDEEAKVRLGYADPRSFVRLDGSEVLYGEDWKRRKDELWKRAEGRCEYWTEGGGFTNYHSGYRCMEESGDPCHVEPRHPKRDDRLNNLKFYCRYHHSLSDKQSWRRPRFSNFAKHGREPRFGT